MFFVGMKQVVYHFKTLPLLLQRDRVTHFCMTSFWNEPKEQ